MWQIPHHTHTHLVSSISFSLWEFFLVFLEGLGRLRGSSMGVCEALCDMLSCKKGYTNTFDLTWYTFYTKYELYFMAACSVYKKINKLSHPHLKANLHLWFRVEFDGCSGMFSDRSEVWHSEGGGAEVLDRRGDGDGYRRQLPEGPEGRSHSVRVSVRLCSQETDLDHMLSSASVL